LGKISRFYLEHNIPFSFEAMVEISRAGYVPEAIFSHLYIVYKTRYSSALCSLQYYSTAASEIARFIVWSCNGRADVNLKNPSIFTTLVKMTIPTRESEGVRIRKFSVRVIDAGQRSASTAELQPRISSQSTSAKFVV